MIFESLALKRWLVDGHLCAHQREMPVSVNKNTPFAGAAALRHSSINSTPAPDLALFKLVFPGVFFSGGMFFSQTPASKLRSLADSGGSPALLVISSP